jgi:hypothetical protein
MAAFKQRDLLLLAAGVAGVAAFFVFRNARAGAPKPVVTDKEPLTPIEQAKEALGSIGVPFDPLQRGRELIFTIQEFFKGGSPPVDFT